MPISLWQCLLSRCSGDKRFTKYTPRWRRGGRNKKFMFGDTNKKRRKEKRIEIEIKEEKGKKRENLKIGP